MYLHKIQYTFPYLNKIDGQPEKEIISHLSIHSSYL